MRNPFKPSRVSERAAERAIERDETIENLSRAVASLSTTVESLQAQLKTARAASLAAKPAAKKNLGIRVAIVGTRGHGQKHIAAFGAQKDCTITHICDVDTKVGKAAVEQVASKYGHRPKLVSDFRELLKDKAVDAVAIATPHHWHALSLVWALQAGKHVYIEKPITHAFDEGPSVLAAARKYDRVVQAGTQLRSNTSLAAAGEFMRAGGLGDIEVVHCIIHKDRPPLPLSNDNKIPATVDYDLWCGPAPQDDLVRSKFHYHWHWFWEFGNGALGNNGIHRIDAARIALDLKGYGDLVLSYGGRFGPHDNGETPNNQITLHRFGKTWIVQDVLGLSPKAYEGLENAVVFRGTKGRIVYATGKAVLLDDAGEPARVFEGKQLSHYRNFLDAIAAKNGDAVRGDLDEAVISGDLCHLGNASYRMGETATDEEIAAVVAELKCPPFVDERLKAMRANISDNGLDSSITLGRTLQLDPAAPVGTNPIIGEPDADQFMTRTYRSPFVLPQPSNV